MNLAAVAAAALFAAAAVTLCAAAAVPIRTIAVGSCNSHDDAVQPIFATATALGAELWIWLGDAVYGDSQSFYELQPFIWNSEPEAVKKERYDALKYRSDYQAMLHSVPAVIGVWDDHDFGLNSADGSYPDRVMAQRLYLDFVDEPPDSPRRSQSGIYASYTYGEAPNKVKVILLDVRYNRDANDLLGEAQWAWLERELTGSDAAVHLIGSGIQILPLEKPMQEKWSQFPVSRERLLAVIARTRTPGVILLSGDIHWAEMLRTECSPVSYPLYELTTSGMSHSCDTQIPLCQWQTTHGLLTDSHRTAVYTHFNFATVEFDWTARVVTLNLRGPEGDVKFSERVPIATLQVSATEPVRKDWDLRMPRECAPVAAWRDWREQTFVLLFFGAATAIAVALCCACAVYVRRRPYIAVSVPSGAGTKTE